MIKTKLSVWIRQSPQGGKKNFIALCRKRNDVIGHWILHNPNQKVIKSTRELLRVVHQTYNDCHIMVQKD